MSLGMRLLESLRRQVAFQLEGINDELQVKVMRHWISFRSQRVQRVFAELRPHRRDLEAFILPPVEALEGENGLAESSPPTQGWGWFQSRFRLVREEDVKAATDLVLQSYVFRARMGTSRRHFDRISDPSPQRRGPIQEIP